MTAPAPLRVLVFPGQGAQTTGMGGELFDRYPALVAEADDVLGWSVAEVCRDNPGNILLRTEYAQPALYVVEALSLLAYRDDGGPEPDRVAGHSLGEYPALFAAGVFDFATGLRLVQRRGRVMARGPSGSMAALLGLDLEQVRQLLDRLELTELDIALRNAPGQVAVAGPADALDRLVEAAFDEGIRCVRLNVSGPFHSRYMRRAADRFSRFLPLFDLAPPSLPVIANVTARPHEPGRIPDALVDQIQRTVLWEDTVGLLLDEAEAAGREAEFVELGPGRTLTGMVDRIRRARPPALSA